MDRVLELPRLLPLLRMAQLLAAVTLVLLVVTERELLLRPAAIKVQLLTLGLRRLKVERRLLRARRQMAKAVKEMRLAKEMLVATELAEMPGMALLPQTVEELTRLEPAPLPFPIQQPLRRFSISLRKH